VIDAAVLGRVREVLIGKKLLLLARGRSGNSEVEVVGTPSKWAGGDLSSLTVQGVGGFDNLPDATACLEVVFEGGYSLDFFVLGSPYADHKGWGNWISALFCAKESVPAQCIVIIDTQEVEDGEFYEFLFDDGSKIVVEKKGTQGSDLSWATELFIILKPSGGGSVELLRVEE